ncbi:LysR family transcriptional regulator [Rhizobium halophytocola]|uniref:DNA-binding transcriptional LysR family regulator n=1 Tax=Rhizobium halophytocola TaxID=735519 RepID=A0ABS4E3M3_9HYPH|nr:LysR substrate-binding domain-containing protein [Rhizobium halophytocola]MBP1852543.1 DNA-binding transcriptional LysR family regulator [Rhizobium halophytocola]
MALPLESDLLRIFLAVAEYENVTRAADVLGRTQSAVSMQVKRLEEVAGTPLFTRGPRGMTLTETGQRLLPYARRIVRLVDETTASLRVQPLDGPVRIGIPEEYNQLVLPRALAAFAERHPATEVTVMCGYSEQQTRALTAGQIDLAVVFDVNGSSGEVLAIDPTVWVSSVAHDCHLRDPVPIGIYWNSSWCRDFAIRSLQNHGVNYRISYTCDTTGGLKGAAAAGLAVVPLARSTIPADCRELTAAEGFPPIDASRVVLRRNRERSSPAVEELASMLRDAFSPLTSPLPPGSAGDPD